jgi:hypothetical protein
MTYRRRLELVQATTRDLRLTYDAGLVWRFALRNVAALLFGFPLFFLGMVLFAIPFYIPRWLVKVLKQPIDRQGTIKFSCALVLAPLCLAALSWAAWRYGGTAWAIMVLVGAIPLAVFTRYFLERRRIALHDMQVFFTLGSRARLRTLLLSEGDRLAREIEETAVLYRPRVLEPAPRGRVEPTGT